VLDPAQFPTRFSESPHACRANASRDHLPPCSRAHWPGSLSFNRLHEIGRYGGTCIGRSSVERLPGAARFTSGPDSLLYWDYGGSG